MVFFKTGFYYHVVEVLQAVIAALELLGLPEVQHLICFIRLQLCVIINGLPYSLKERAFF